MTAVRLTVEIAGNPLRAERLTRQLREHLDDFGGVEANLEVAQLDAIGAKGVTEILSVTVTVGWALKFAEPALRAWFERNKNNHVVIEKDGIRIVLDGQSSVAQLRMLEGTLLAEPETDNTDAR
ncbi:hypothetical protein [Pseudonocardia spinosispora]|uniref:hypothetical protein n=1 Tax=Pseudonocardia spinosispora TaxID=103441 RepID=UPI0012EC30D1|nr:hypothetical protein [Pseudonocardia spinosispora]